MTMIAGLFPVFIFLFTLGSYESTLLHGIDRSVRSLQVEVREETEAVAKTLSEERVRQKAVDTALEVALYLGTHREMTARDLRNDRSFREIAVQRMGRTGYTAVHESTDRAVNLAHPSPSVENKELKSLEKEFPRFWSIVEAGMGGKVSSGYYDWRDSDGVIRQKYMHIQPVGTPTADGVPLCVAATILVDEFQEPVNALAQISERFSREILSAVTGLFSSYRSHGVFLFMITAFLTLAWSFFTGLSLAGVVNRFREAIREINRGNFAYRMEPGMSGDVRDMMAEFNTMAARLEDTMVSRSKLEESEAKLSSIIDFLPDPTFAVDRSGTIILWNRAMEELTGVKRSDVGFTGDFEHARHFYGKKRPMLVDYVLSPDLPHEGHYSHYYREGDMIIAEARIDFRLHGNRWIWGKASPIFNREGILTGAIESMRDVTDRKQLEEALKRSEERFRTVVMHSGIGTALADLDGRFTLVNPAFCRMLGFSGEELQEKDLLDISHPDERLRDRLLLDRLRAGETPFRQIEKRFIRRDGRLLWTLLNVTLVRDPSGDPMHLIAQIQDITERKETEEALHVSESMLRSIVDSARDAIFVKNLNLRYTLVNRFMADLFERKISEIVGESDEDLMDPETAARVREVDRQVLQGAAIEEESERPIQGIVRTFHAIKVPLKNGEGRIMGLCGISRDITERKRLEGLLFQSQKMEAVGTLAGGMAHDFNNLLMGIQGYTSLMLMDLDPGHPHYGRLKSIEEQVKSGADLSRQILGFARGGKYDVRPADLNELMGKTALLFGRTRKEIRIRESFHRDLRRVEVDRNQVEQVLMNLFLNASQAMPAGGDLSIETGNVDFDEEDVKPYGVRPGRYVMMVITDTGVGMDEKTLSRIFEPFFTTKEMGRGTGLGLAAVYGIVKGYGGFIQVESEPGRGSTFRIFLPASEKEIPVETAQEPPSVRGAETILVVDDEEVILGVLDEWLTSLGYHVITANGAAAALEIFGNRPKGVDLVILDMIMPGMGGGEVLDRLKVFDPDVAVILSSGYSVEGEASRIMERGVRAFIQKPFQMKEFSRMIREVLDGDGRHGAGERGR
jgi:PAS domain S-box-containing protein